MWDEDRSFQLTFFFRDDDAAIGTGILHVPIASIAAVTAFCLNIADLLRAVSHCALIKFRISISAAAKSPPIPSGVSAANYGVFIFQTATPDERCIVGIPGFKPAKLVTSGPWGGPLLRDLREGAMLTENAVRQMLRRSARRAGVKLIVVGRPFESGQPRQQRNRPADCRSRIGGAVRVRNYNGGQ